MYCKLFPLLILLTFSICKGQVNREKTFESFPRERSLSTKEIFSIHGISPYHLMLFNDTLIVIRHDESLTGYHFSTYSTNSREKVMDLLPSGRKQGESLTFLSFGLLDEQLWVFDLLKEAILFAPINQRKALNEEIPLKNTNYYKIQPISKTVFMCSGDHEASFLLEQVDLNKGKVVESYFPFPDGYPRTKKEEYESFLYKHPSQNKYFLASRYADYLQLADVENGTKKEIYGPEGFGPHLKLAKNAEGKEFMSISADTRFGYVRGQVTEKFIYLLVSGNLRSSEEGELGKSIVVFDWNGEPKERILLENAVVDFVVSSDDSTIYLYNPKSKNIESGKLY